METLRINRLMLAAVAILVGLACWMGWGLGQNTDAEAHNIGWKWRYPSVTPKVTSLGTSHIESIVSAVNDYDYNTDLTVRWCVFPCTANIYHEEVNWGHHVWPAAVDSYSNGRLCNGDTSICNTTNKRVNLAYVRWNHAYPWYEDGSAYNKDFAHYAARHEMGHAFGLAHTDTSRCGRPPSVMGCPTPTTLQQHDKLDINRLY